MEVEEQMPRLRSKMLQFRAKVLMWGPAYLKSTAMDRCFYTDDIVIPTEVPLNQPDLVADPGGDLPHLPEREDAPAQPLFHGNAPTRRLRRKTAPPPAIPLVSMLHIEGEKLFLQRYMGCFEFQLPRDPENDVVFPVPSEDSWTLETEQSPRQAPLPDDDEDENESGGEGHDDGRASVILRKFQFWKTWA